MLKIKIQSFGDLITNSSSEVYCIYDLRGVEQVKNAVNEIAFGANFYNNLLTQDKIKCWLYPPESFSKNLILDDIIKITPSSFNLTPIKEIKYERNNCDL